MNQHDDDIVISGIAGRYPDCDSFDEFKEALLSGVDLITEDSRRWEPGTWNVPSRAGKINNVEYFDAGYFGVIPRQANVMDPRQRVMYETVFEAILDSGYNPKELRGTKTGVYVGIGQLDNHHAYQDIENTYGYTVIGTWLGQIANRTSYCFDFRGPSFVLDTACSTGFFALGNAIKAMERGDIDSAVVSAVQINFHPHPTKEFNLLNMLAADGRCKVFSTERDGYARSEAIVTVILQKRSQCRRLYSTVMGMDFSCDGYKAEGITFPSSQAQLDLIRSIYKNKNLNPDDVIYVEMHGTGTPVGDLAECKSICEFFCKNRDKPLPVGSVKSNVGHTEISAGLCSVTKVIVAMETGIIPANINCDNLDYSLPGIGDGTLKVVTENLPWNGGLVSLNCFGFGGTNAHLVLKSNDRQKLRPKKTDYRLVNVSGRTEESVKYFLDGAAQHQDDREFLALLDEIHKIDVEGHPYRGYTILGNNRTSNIKKIAREKRPVWFIYSGMGSQWTGMGKDLMKIDIFRNTIKKCANALKPYNVDLEHILTSDDPKVFEDISNCFSAITATEIALTDVIRAFGIEPDGFAGHSLGEVGCAYCNGELTPEQAMLIGFARGYATVRSKSPPGRMAAVGLGKHEIAKWLPENVFIACVNGSNSVTVTGLKEPVENLVAALTAKGIFAKLVETAGYAFHSKYIDDAVPYLHDFVAKVLMNPRFRSSKWVSSSRDESEWDHPESQLNSAEYHKNNYRNTVLFDQVLRHIPKDAILIEIAPHGLLTSVLKREMGPEATCLSLANKNSNDNVQFLLSTVGELFINGGQPNLRQFYKEVSLPVGRGTGNIGSLIKWDHSVKWFTPFFESNKSFGKRVTINTGEENHSYLKGHNIDGRVLMSATGYLEVAWKVIADANAKTLEKLPVVFENVKFLRATVLPDNENVAFYVNIMRQSGYFEIFEGGSVCCSGTIKLPKEISKDFLIADPPPKSTTDSGPSMLKRDIYKWFHLKRYMYDGLFQGVELIDVAGTVGTLKWHGRFTSFLDTMLQVSLVPEYSAELLLPTKLQKLTIDPERHLKEVALNDNEIAVYHDKDLKLIKSGGIELINLEVSVAPKRQHIQADPVLECSTFVPYITENSAEADNNELSLRVAVQIVNENVEPSDALNVCELVTKKEASLVQLATDLCKSDPLLNVAFVDSKSPKIDLILCPDGLVDGLPLDALNNGGFVLVFGFRNDCTRLGLPVVYENSFNGKGAFLLRKIKPIETYAIINVKNTDFQWLDQLKAALKDEELVYVINEDDDECSGILGLVRCLNIEPKDRRAAVKCILIGGASDVRDSFRDPEIFKNHFSNQLTMNVLNSGGEWGSYRYLPVNPVKNIDVSSACNLIQTIGDLSSFRWFEMPSDYQKLSNRILVYVFYAALNFKDVMIATGKVVSNSGDLSLTDVEMGLEYSGMSTCGKRLMGICCPSISLQLLTDPLFTWEIPETWSLEEAATVPVVYSTCYYGLIMRSQMQEGESILIHAGAGGIGIAAISIALSMNCQIFTTVGSQEKKDFLLKLFPQLKPENIGNTRNASFEQMIMKNTKGKGVDLVLNSLAADLFQASIRCVARRGRFIEIGKVDMWAGTPVSASLFSKNTSFHGVLLDDFFDSDVGSNAAKLEINRLLYDGIKKGVVRPLPRIVFGEDEVEDAYRLLSTGKHKGKVLIKLRDEQLIDCPRRTIKALPRIYFDPDKTYVLVGGLGGFGLELTNFLIKRCARKIVLNSRRGLSNGYQSLCMRRWAQLTGVTVKITTNDTSTLQGAIDLIEFAEELGPVGGVFNMALVLKDALFVNQTPETYDAVFKSKIYSGLNLDKVTRAKCPKLDHFVVFSSLVAGRGNPGQSNYGMANSALERLCEKRRNDGLPALAVEYGPVGDVGAVAGSSKYEKTISAMGLDFQTIRSCIDALETFMLQPYTVGSTFVKADQNALSTGSDKTPVETVAHILGIKNLELIDKNLPLSDIGLDSLTGAEIKQTLYRNFNIQVAAEDIRDLTFNKIALMGQSPNSNDVPSLTNGDVKEESFSAMLPEEIIVKIINNKSYPNKVYFIPPIEGNVELMVPLAKRLKANVYGLQFTKSLDSDDMTQYAQYFVKVIKNVQSNGPYVLCGYSYGGSLGFEIAIQLEKMNEHVKLFLIDGTPRYVRQILERKFDKRGKSEEKSRSSILKAFLLTSTPQVQNEEADAIFDDSLDWEQQMGKVGELVAKNTLFSAEEVCASADRYLKRVAAGFFYQPTDVFEGEAHLIRSDNVLDDLPEDYGLQKICKNRIKLDILKGNHREIMLEDNVGKISELINNTLI